MSNEPSPSASAAHVLRPHLDDEPARNARERSEYESALRIVLDALPQEAQPVAAMALWDLRHVPGAAERHQRVSEELRADPGKLSAPNRQVMLAVAWYLVLERLVELGGTRLDDLEDDGDDPHRVSLLLNVLSLEKRSHKTMLWDVKAQDREAMRSEADKALAAVLGTQPPKKMTTALACRAARFGHVHRDARTIRTAWDKGGGATLLAAAREGIATRLASRTALDGLEQAKPALMRAWEPHWRAQLLTLAERGAQDDDPSIRCDANRLADAVRNAVGAHEVSSVAKSAAVKRLRERLENSTL